MRNSYELWLALDKLGFLNPSSPEYWWPEVKTVNVLVGAILVQQTKWENVEKALLNLKESKLLSLEALSQTPIMILEEKIKPAGYYKKKSKVLQQLSHSILETFYDFESFQKNVTREWLLSQKGIGFETADTILCYACGHEVMVVDNYSNKLIQAFGYEFDSYDALQEWFMHGIEENYSEISKHYGESVSFYTIYSRFHGMIVEYMKEHSRGKVIEIEKLL